MHKITNENIFYEISFLLQLNDTPQDVSWYLDDVESFVRIDCDGNSIYCSWPCVTFYFDTPDTSRLGDTTVIGYLDIRKLEKEEQCEFEYRDAWGQIQDKVPLCFLATIVDEEQ